MRVFDIIDDLTDSADKFKKAILEDGDFLIVRRFTSSTITFPANSGMNVEVSITIPEGYRYLTTTMVATNGNVIPGYYMSFNSTTNKVSTWLKNWYTSGSFNASVSVDVLFIKNVGG